MARATWQSSSDSSRIWARATQIVDDPAIIGTGNIPWLLLQRVGASRGPGGGSQLSQTTWIQRVNTVGGVAPATGCSESIHAGALALVPTAPTMSSFVDLRRRRMQPVRWPARR